MPILVRQILFKTIKFNANILEVLYNKYIFYSKFNRIIKFACVYVQVYMHILIIFAPLLVIYKNFAYKMSYKVCELRPTMAYE